jgi:hypothetical protein
MHIHIHIYTPQTVCPECCSRCCKGTLLAQGSSLMYALPQRPIQATALLRGSRCLAPVLCMHVCMCVCVNVYVRMYALPQRPIQATALPERVTVSCSWFVCMYVCMCVCVNVCVRMYALPQRPRQATALLRGSRCLAPVLCQYMYMCVCMYVCMYVFDVVSNSFICMYVCVCIYIYIYIYMRTYTHIYTYT